MSSCTHWAVRWRVRSGPLTSLVLATIFTLGTPAHASEPSQEKTDRCSVPAQSSAQTVVQGDDTAALNRLFALASPGEEIVLPDLHYELAGHVILPHANNVTIDASQARFGGRAIFLANSVSDLHWTGGHFVGDGTSSSRISFIVFKTQDSSFRHMTFTGTMAFGNHVFDLLGSEGIDIDHLEVAGYGNTTDRATLPTHALYTEAIQIDYAREEGVGNELTVELIKRDGGNFDGAASSHIRVRASQFVPRKSLDGNVEAWAPHPFGSHAGSTESIPTDLQFTRNTVIDPIAADGNKTEWTAPLHIHSASNVKIAANYFELSSQSRLPQWIQIGAPSTAGQGNDTGSQEAVSNLTIMDNVFAGRTPTDGFFSPADGSGDDDHSGLSRKVGGNSITALRLGDILLGKPFVFTTFKEE